MRTPRLALAAFEQQAAAILASSKARRADATMTAPVTTDPPKADDPPKQDDPPKADPPKTDEGPKFTQADLDRILGERLAAERATAQRKIQEATELAGKNETEKLTIERDQAKQREAEATAKATERIARTEAKGIARDLDARPDRLTAIIAAADLSKGIKDGEVDEAAMKAELERVLTEYPEWKKAPGGPTASGGELNGQGGGGKPTFTRAQIEAMSSQEVADRIEEINLAAAEGRITG